MTAKLDNVQAIDQGGIANEIKPLEHLAEVLRKITLTLGIN